MVCPSVPAGLWDKHTNFFTNTQAPLMFRVPGLTDGGVFTDQITSTMDIFPTLVELAFGRSMPRCESDSSATKLCTEGNSLTPLILSPNTPVKVAAYSVYQRALTSIPPNASASPAVSLEAPYRDLPLEEDQTSACIDGTGCVIGYSMLTRLLGCELRYTEWVHYEGRNDGWNYWMDTDTVYERELYNHSCRFADTTLYVDLRENHNIAGRHGPWNLKGDGEWNVANALRWRLRQGWKVNFRKTAIPSVNAVESLGFRVAESLARPVLP